MAGRVIWEEEATADFEDAVAHWTRSIGATSTSPSDTQAAVIRNIRKVRADLRKLAETPWLDRAEPDLIINGKQFYWHYAGGRKGMDFKVYFDRVAPKTIRVMRLWPLRREPLDPTKVVEQIKGAAQEEEQP